LVSAGWGCAAGSIPVFLRSSPVTLFNSPEEFFWRRRSCSSSAMLVRRSSSSG
jgi:hypothetical protein